MHCHFHSNLLVVTVGFEEGRAFIGKAESAGETHVREIKSIETVISISQLRSKSGTEYLKTVFDEQLRGKLLGNAVHEC